MGVLWSELSPSGLVVEIDDLLNGITDEVVVLRLVSNLHIALFESHSVRWSPLGWCLSLTTRWSCVTRAIQDLLEIWFVLRYKCCRPLPLSV